MYTTFFCFIKKIVILGSSDGLVAKSKVKQLTC